MRRPRGPLYFWLVVAPVLILAGGFGIAMGTDAAVNDAQKASHPAVTCSAAPQESLVAPSPVQPRIDGIFFGTIAGGTHVAIRFYPDGKLYFAAGSDQAKPEQVREWLTPQYAQQHAGRTGPIAYDTNGSFTRVNDKGTNHYTMWKYDGGGFNLHVDSDAFCKQGTHGETIYMTFLPD
jgi:hypothetical protein